MNILIRPFLLLAAGLLCIIPAAVCARHPASPEFVSSSRPDFPPFLQANHPSKATIFHCDSFSFPPCSQADHPLSSDRNSACHTSAGIPAQAGYPDSLDSVVANFNRQMRLLAQEKIYIHTDKSYYISGERLFFRIHLVDAAYHIPVLVSRYVYVELIDPLDSVVARLKVKPENGAYFGCIFLKEDLADGAYQLRSYTNFMRNTDEAYFFRKVIHIADPGGTSLKTNFEFDDRYHVSFFPEGGNLLAGAVCNVAFKAVGSDGMSEEVTGKITDSKGNELTGFMSAYLGMGNFNLQPKQGEKYYATCKNRQGVEATFELPDVKTAGADLKTNWVKGKLAVSILRTTDTMSGQFYLLMHCRGTLVHASAWDGADKPVFFDPAEFPTGVLHLILLNREFHPVSERLVFVDNHDQAIVDYKSDKPVYGRRDRIQNHLVIRDNRLPLSGSFSVAVTDDHEVIADSSQNILTNLLLTSDLRGYIENPASYFDSHDKKAGFKLDLLMMTQGWRRYDIPNVLAGKMTRPVFKVETSQQITGKVQNGILLKETENAQVMIASQNNDFIDQTETDQFGRFVFRNFELPDSTRYLIRTVSAKGSERMVLTVDEENFPEAKPWSYPQASVDETDLKAYVQKEEQRYTREHGMRQVDLDEITVNAKRLPETRSSYTSYADQSLTAEQIGKAGGLTTLKLVDRLPGVEVDAQGAISIRGKSPVMLLVNDVETDLEYIDDIEAEDVLRIDLIHATNTFGQKSANGIISISTKSLEGIAEKKRFNMISVTPLGYHKPVEFYSPVYDTEQARENPEPDLRTTIYWNPNVVVENGNATFGFYAADNPSVYRVVIEGVSSDGKLIHYTGKLVHE